MFDSSEGIDLIDSYSILCLCEYVNSFDGNMLSSDKVDSFEDFTVRTSAEESAVKDAEAVRRAWIDHWWSIVHDC